MSLWKKLFGSKESPRAGIAGRGSTRPSATTHPQPASIRPIPATRPQELPQAAPWVFGVEEPPKPNRRVIEGHKGQNCRVLSMAASADGKVVLSASEDGNVKVWDVARAGERHSLCSDGSMVCGVAVSADGKTAVSASYWALSVWDLKSGQERQRLKKANWVGGLALSATERSSSRRLWKES